jgi:hypothetical protein
VILCYKDKKMTYELELREGFGWGVETIFMEDVPTSMEIKEHCVSWGYRGDYGDDGANVVMRWTLTDDEGIQLDDGEENVYIKPNHAALIVAAGGDFACNHDWSSEGEGGCSENPGVWSTGGTSMVFKSHCTHCGLRRTERTTGSQRNPGECDTVSYEMPDE